MVVETNRTESSDLSPAFQQKHVVIHESNIPRKSRMKTEYDNLIDNY